MRHTLASIGKKSFEFGAMSWHERQALFQALVLLPMVVLELRLFGFRMCVLHLARWNAVGSECSLTQPADALNQAQQTARAVSFAARHGICRASCLHQSLVLWWLLRRQGLKAAFRIGVRIESGNIEAHAWLEYQGQPLHQQADVLDEFTVLEGNVVPAQGSFREALSDA